MGRWTGNSYHTLGPWHVSRSGPCNVQYRPTCMRARTALWMPRLVPCNFTDDRAKCRDNDTPSSCCSWSPSGESNTSLGHTFVSTFVVMFVGLFSYVPIRCSFRGVPWDVPYRSRCTIPQHTLQHLQVSSASSMSRVCFEHTHP